MAADASRFPQGIIIDSAGITIARPVGVLVFDTLTQLLWRSTNASTPQYSPVTGGTAASAFRGEIVTPQTLTHNTATVLLWTATTDTGSAYNPLTGEYEIPATGLYRFTAFVTWEANATGVSRTCNLQVNPTSGVTVAAGVTVQFDNWATTMPTPAAIPWNHFVCVRECTAGQFARIHCKQDSTIGLNVQPLLTNQIPYFAAERIA